jgi:hypothetical protein
MKRNAVRPDGDGNGRGYIGGWGMRSNQSEFITSNISTQIQGWFWATSFGVIALATVYGIILAIGPDSVWFIGQAAIVAVLIQSLRSLSDVPDEQMDLAKFLLVIYVLFATALSIVLWFIPAEYYWPISRQVVIVSFASIPFISAALMAFSLLAGAVNPATYAPYRPRNPSGRLRDAFLPTDPPEYGENDSDGNQEDGYAQALEDMRAMIQQMNDNKPVIQRRTVFVNGQHKHDEQEAGDNAT